MKRVEAAFQIILAKRRKSGADLKDGAGAFTGSRSFGIYNLQACDADASAISFSRR